MAVWNGWGYGIALFPGLRIFKFRRLKFERKSLFLRTFKDFPGNLGLERIFFGVWKWPFHTPPIHTPTKCLLMWAILSNFSPSFEKWRGKVTLESSQNALHLGQLGNMEFEESSLLYLRRLRSSRNGPFALFSGKFVWSNGAEISSKVSPRLALVHGWLFPVGVVLAHLSGEIPLGVNMPSFYIRIKNGSSSGTVIVNSPCRRMSANSRTCREAE